MVKRLSLIVSLLLVLLTTGVALSKPDLVVTDISWQPQSPHAGEEVTITATVRNVGTSDAEGRFYVRFLMDGTQIDAPSISFGLDAGRTKAVSVSWTAQLGTHTIVVEADQPFDRIDESNEANNTLPAAFVVRISPSSTSRLASLKVAVARFDDRSGSGFINVGEGVADELIAWLVKSGVRVLERSELEAVMQERGLNPAFTSDLATAGQILGADLLIIGSVTRVDVQQVSFSLGFFSVSSAAVDVAMSARLVNVYTTEIVKAVSSEGKEEGATGFSVDIGKIVALSQPAATNVCTGGLCTDKSYYYTGETVNIGYLNPGPSAWYDIVIETSGGTPLKWLGWQFINTGGCKQWFWDQRNTLNLQMPPGMYTAKLWDGISYIAPVNFQIKPGSGPPTPLIDEIRVGSNQFDETIVGRAANSALNELVFKLIQGMEEVAPAVLATRGALALAGEAPTPEAREGQIARILDDGRIAINIGASHGVTKGDFFQVLDTTNLIVDPATGKVLAYDVLDVKGEIVITEVRDLVSYGVQTSEFVALVGDIVRPSAP